MNNMYEVLVCTLGAGACWLVWFYLIKEQRVDIFREELFALRKDLFLLAASGEISFENYSYVELRNLINGMLRYAHRISLSTSFVASKLSELEPTPINHFERWKQSLALLTPEVREHLELIHLRMFRAYMNQLVRGSVFLFLVHLSFLAKATLSSILASSPRAHGPRLDVTDEAFHRIANNFDAKALEEQAYRDQTDSQHALPA